MADIETVSRYENRFIEAVCWLVVNYNYTYEELVGLLDGAVEVAHD